MSNLDVLTQIVGKYADPKSLLVAGGPLALAGVVRLCVAKKSKLANIALAGGTAWFAVRELAGPIVGLVQDNFGAVQTMFGGIR